MNEREVARELLRELLDGALAHRNGGSGNGHGHGGGEPPAPPQVPAPPVAAVLRPSTWRDPAPGEAEAAGAAGGHAERVTIASDAELDRFVRSLAERLEDPAARAAVRSGRLRFTLGSSSSSSSGSGSGSGSGGGGRAPGGPVVVERGAVTERTVAQAARSGARLVLGPRAVLTPLAREKARAAGVEIERRG